ncbi:MAG: hypothetical protein ISS70_12425 [Phycisphaerae bacterium]|nr:hypothetical protein [Phycisphaerae bacterium]
MAIFIAWPVCKWVTLCVRHVRAKDGEEREAAIRNSKLNLDGSANHCLKGAKTARQCFYCDKETEVDPRFLNPNTNEIHPICAECKALILTYRHELTFFVKLMWPIGPLLIVMGVISLIFISWKLGLLLIIVAVLAAFVSILGVENFRVKKEKKLGTYVDVKKIQWCKTCKHFRKTRNWNSLSDPLWRSSELISSDEIPCLIVEATKSVWVQYFNKEEGQRHLYPKNCDKWSHR